jgi:hypothetical protein
MESVREILEEYGAGDARPSAKLVLVELVEAGDEEMTRPKLHERTRMSYNSVWRGVRDLEEGGVVETYNRLTTEFRPAKSKGVRLVE